MSCFEPSVLPSNLVSCSMSCPCPAHFLGLTEVSEWAILRPLNIDLLGETFARKITYTVFA